MPKFFSGAIRLHSDNWQCCTQKLSIRCQNFGVPCQFFGTCKWGYPKSKFQTLLISEKLIINFLNDPSHPLCFARFEGDMRHFRCHRNSSFLQCEFKSFYILPNTAHSGLNSPSTRCQTISGFIHWIICELFVIFRIKSVTQTRECSRTSLWFESQLKQH